MYVRRQRKLGDPQDIVLVAPQNRPDFADLYPELWMNDPFALHYAWPGGDTAPADGGGGAVASTAANTPGTTPAAATAAASAPTNYGLVALAAIAAGLVASRIVGQKDR